MAIDLIKAIEQEQLRTDLQEVEIGDYVKVHLKVKEGNRERIQIFEGTVIAKKGGSVKETITVRKVSYGIGVERILPIHAYIWCSGGPIFVNHLDLQHSYRGPLVHE